MPNFSWRLVIDASLLRAAGSAGATHPRSAQSRRLLLDILKMCHRAVLSDAIKREWDTHQSTFARTWRVQMYSQRKIAGCTGRDCQHLKRAVERSEHLSGRQRDAAIKDFLLIEAALNGDQIIFSLDDRARAVYCELSKAIRDFADIYWLNPVAEIVNTGALLQGLIPFKATWKLDPTRGV